MDNKLKAFQRLLTIMDELRTQCPWDKKQTMDSLRHLTIEETYELCDAIIKNDSEEIKGELGDLMLHLVFYSKIASETQQFDISDVLNTVCDKLIVRHPHIYGDVEAKTEQEVKENWEKIKLKEGKKSVLEGVPNSLPALVKAIRIQDKVKGLGFDWDNAEQVWEKVQEELQEYKEEEDRKNQVKMEEEYGDLLFSMVNYARFVGINPEDALEKTNQKFMNRFTKMEEIMTQEKQHISEMKLAEMDLYWEKAKAALKSNN